MELELAHLERRRFGLGTDTLYGQLSGQDMAMRREPEETMRAQSRFLVAVVTVVAAGLTAPATVAQVEVEKPQPSVAETVTIEGGFTRIAYTEEGWVTLGYRLANESQGEEWMLLEVGVTVHKGVKKQKMKRDSFTVTLPDGSTVPMATIREYQQAHSLRALNLRGDTVRDPINYFPVAARGLPCDMLFFSDPISLREDEFAYDQFGLNWRRACVGRLFFKMPEGKTIEPGQYWLNVQFANSVVQAPFRIMTEEEEKFFRKNWKDLKKEHAAYLKEQAEKAKQQQE
jgi:hypothetical protein